MGKDHRGKPSGINKIEGLGAGFNPDILPDDRYIKNEDTLQDGVRELHPNRHTTKTRSTRAAKK